MLQPTRLRIEKKHKNAEKYLMHKDCSLELRRDFISTARRNFVVS